MLDSLGYLGVRAASLPWLEAMAPIALLIAGIALALSLVGFGLDLFARRASAGSDSGPSGMDTSRIR